MLSGTWILTLAVRPDYSQIHETGFIDFCNKIKQSKEVQLYGWLHCDICNVIPYLLPGIRLQIKFTKAKPAFYLMNATTKFQFLGAYLIVNRMRPNPAHLIAHNIVLSKSVLARYNLTRVELKSFTFAGGPITLSIGKAILVQLPKRLLFTMIKITKFIGSLNTNPYYIRNFGVNHFTLFYNGKPNPSEGLHMDMRKPRLWHIEVWGIRHTSFRHGTADN